MKYHLIGDQGVSMSAIADFLRREGHIVSGSDIKTTGHNEKNVSNDIDVVVRTSAVNKDSSGWVEVQKAKELGIPVVKRSELLGEITSKYTLIAISGMHGKTTTTSLVGLILIQAGMDPTVLVGEKIKEFNNKALRIGNSNYFVMEACEYDRSFLNFQPNILVLTNIDEEHLDTYPGGMEEITKAFSKYVKKVRDGGVIIANADDENILKVVHSINTRKNKIIWYGKNSDKYYKLNYHLSIQGEHNENNALAALALADYLDIDRKHCEKVFNNFTGAKRRLEYWGEYNQALLYDDYGHHPTEIKATVKALKNKYPDRELIVIFWPHQYKRIKTLFEKFSKSFFGSDKVFVKEIFFVPGRDELLDISSKELAENITKSGTEALSFKENPEIINEIKKISHKKTVILTIGIPPIYKLLEEITGE